MAGASKLKEILAEYVSYCQSCSNDASHVRFAWLANWFDRLNTEPPPVEFELELIAWNDLYEREYAGPGLKSVKAVLKLLPKAKGKGGRPPLETEAKYLKRLTEHERDAITLSESRSASQIDEVMRRERKVDVVIKGKTKLWPYGHAKKVIGNYRLWKKRRDLATK